MTDRVRVVLPSLAGRVPQVDVLKGLAIIAVLLLHGLPVDLLFNSGAQLHIGQAVAIFAVLMGLNAFGSSARRQTATVRAAYTREYLRSRIDRLYVPFLPIFAVSLIAATVDEGFRPGFLAGLVTGELARSGPGNYFIGLAFQFALLGPASYLAYRRAPRTTIAVVFGAAGAFELAAPHVALFDTHPYFYAASIVRFAPFIVLGLAIADRMARGERLPAWWSAAALAGLGYLVLVCFDHGVLNISTIDWRRWGQNVLSAHVSALVVVAGLWRLPATGRAVDLLSALGSASYHIFLVQIMWFSFTGTGSLVETPFDVIACCALGYAFWAIMERRALRPPPLGPDVVVPPATP